MLTAPRSGGHLEGALRAVAASSSGMDSRSLSKGFRRGVRLKTDGFQRVPIMDATSVAGDPEAGVATVHMDVRGEITGAALLAADAIPRGAGRGVRVLVLPDSHGRVPSPGRVLLQLKAPDGNDPLHRNRR